MASAFELAKERVRNKKQTIQVPEDQEMSAWERAKSRVKSMNPETKKEDPTFVESVKKGFIDPVLQAESASEHARKIAGGLLMEVPERVGRGGVTAIVASPEGETGKSFNKYIAEGVPQPSEFTKETGKVHTMSPSQKFIYDMSNTYATSPDVWIGGVGRIGSKVAKKAVSSIAGKFVQNVRNKGIHLDDLAMKTHGIPEYLTDGWMDEGTIRAILDLTPEQMEDLPKALKEAGANINVDRIMTELRLLKSHHLGTSKDFLEQELRGVDSRLIEVSEELRKAKRAGKKAGKKERDMESILDLEAEKRDLSVEKSKLNSDLKKTNTELASPNLRLDESSMKKLDGPTTFKTRVVQTASGRTLFLSDKGNLSNDFNEAYDAWKNVVSQKNLSQSPKIRRISEIMEGMDRNGEASLSELWDGLDKLYELKFPSAIGEEKALKPLLGRAYGKVQKTLSDSMVGVDPDWAAWRKTYSNILEADPSLGPMAEVFKAERTRKLGRMTMGSLGGMVAGSVFAMYGHGLWAASTMIPATMAMVSVVGSSPRQYRRIVTTARKMGIQMDAFNAAMRESEVAAGAWLKSNPKQHQMLATLMYPAARAAAKENIGNILGYESIDENFNIADPTEREMYVTYLKKNFNDVDSTEMAKAITEARKSGTLWSPKKNEELAASLFFDESGDVKARFSP